MKYFFIVLILLIAVNLSAVRWSFNELKDDEFGKHFFMGAVTSEIGWEVASFFLDKNETEYFMNKNGTLTSIKYRTQSPNHNVIKVISGLVFTSVFAVVTKQEAEPDMRAISAGCFGWLGFKILLSLKG